MKETSAFWGITLIYLKKMNLVLLLKNVCDNKHLYLRLKTCLIPLSNEQCTWFEDMGKSNGKAMEAKRGRTVEQRVMDRGKLKKQSQHQWHRKTGWQAISL